MSKSATALSCPRRRRSRRQVSAYGAPVYLENLVMDAVEPQRLGRFWAAVVRGERLTDGPDGFETRLTVPGGPVLDLCFQRVAGPPAVSPRLHLDLAGGDRQAEEVDRLLGLGARRLDLDLRLQAGDDPDDVAAGIAGRGGRELHPAWGELPWRHFADPSGNEFCVLPARS